MSEESERAPVTVPFLAFDEADAERAAAAWGLNCGPAALAACLGWTLDEVRPHLGDFESRGYLSPTTMLDSVRRSGHLRIAVSDWPIHGLVRIQWGGPWLGPGVPAKAAYRYTHWVASKRVSGRVWVFDINGGWLVVEEWESSVVPRIVASIGRADGTWKPTHNWEVRKAP